MEDLRYEFESYMRKVLFLSLNIILLTNAVTSKRDRTILYSRIAIVSLIYSSILLYSNFYLSFFQKSVTLYNGLLYCKSYTLFFTFFIFFLSSVILTLTSFYPRKIIYKKNLLDYPLFFGLKRYYIKLINKNGEQFKITEYSLIILFIIMGAIFLISSSDIISVFLSIELQSYGLYLLSTIYRNSELSTNAGLTYFLLGGLSSCIILLGQSLLYINSGNTNLDVLYIINSILVNDIQEITRENISIINVPVSYQNYIQFSLIILSTGFLFKVSAAPFHFWSPDRGSWNSSPFGTKLSNSRDLLKLLIPNHIWKVVSGWINYSCMVTSQKIFERKMDNHGSKSRTIKVKPNIFVKEQRVNGSYNGNFLPLLRCTLTGFERNYQVKNHSNLIIQRRFYSNTYKHDNIINNKQIQLIQPWFITGFTDAEGCFLIILRKANNNLGWKLEANFTINLHKRDLELLKLIQIYFEGVGRIGKERNGCCDYTIGSLDQILTKLIPHFDKYPLKTQKFADYLLFREAVMMMKHKEHLTKEGLQKIINIRASLNKGLTPALKEAFPNTIPVPRPQLIYVKSQTLCPQWVAGFTSGDGSFKVSIRTSKAYKVGGRVAIIFVLTQHIRDELLLKSLVNFFKCGHTYSYENHAEFMCQSFSDNYEKILPFFRKYPIIGIKSKDFEDWAKVAELIKTKAHLTKEGFYQISQIVAGMNKRREIK